jgi:putative tryptophan/tyrosine transport system substrate-binding protein
MTRVSMVATFALALLAAPLAAEAQAGKVYRIGYLLEAGGSLRDPYLGAFLGGMRKLGYTEGENLVIELRSAKGSSGALPDLATGLARLNVDVILTAGDRAIRAAQEATKTIPIVMASGPDPVEAGLVASLARPGGNLTGLTLDVASESKRLEILKETVPHVARVALLHSRPVTPRFPAGPPFTIQYKEGIAAAQILRIALVPVLFDEAADLRRAFETVIREHSDGLYVAASAPLFNVRNQIADFAVRHRLPTVTGLREFAAAGGLVSYGANIEDQFRRSASYVDRILRGAKAGDLPMEQPTRFELVINLRTAKALGLTIPPAVLARADEVIQ